MLCIPSELPSLQGSEQQKQLNKKITFFSRAVQFEPPSAQGQGPKVGQPAGGSWQMSPLRSGRGLSGDSDGPAGELPETRSLFLHTFLQLYFFLFYFIFLRYFYFLFLFKFLFYIVFRKFATIDCKYYYEYVRLRNELSKIITITITITITTTIAIFMQFE